MDNYPSNSHTTKVKTEKPKIQKVTKGRATIKKKTFWKQLADTFLGDNANVDSITTYVIHDILVPVVRNTFSDILIGSIEMFFGGSKTTNRYGRRDRSSSSYVSYDRQFDRDRERDRQPSRQRHAYSSHKFDNVFFEGPTALADARDVFNSMVDYLEQYPTVSIAELYEFTGTRSDNFTNGNYGWTNLSTASVKPVRGGWIIDFPPVELLV
jgi:hypothetical protein